jgi:4-hydroxy-2-oxoglutarate aldolase
VIEAAREVAGGQALLIAGCGEQSTRATIANCRSAQRAGANFALVLPPSYFKGRMQEAALLAHYHTIADASPLPVVIYNMPASAAGLDLSAALICTLARHPNIVAVKDSAGDIAKLAEIVAQTPPTFTVFAGSAGYLLPALAVGAHGAVAALANVLPRQVCQIQSLFDAGRLREARQLQARLIPANTAVTSTWSVPGLKAALEMTVGYGGRPRSPLQPLGEAERKRLAEILEVAPHPL